jgi:hypothetical protein
MSFISSQRSIPRSTFFSDELVEEEKGEKIFSYDGTAKKSF